MHTEIHTSHHSTWDPSPAHNRTWHRTQPNVEIFSECMQMILYTSLDMMFMFHEHRPTVIDMNILGWNASHYGCEWKSKVMFRMSFNIQHITKSPNKRSKNWILHGVIPNSWVRCHVTLAKIVATDMKRATKHSKFIIYRVREKKCFFLLWWKEMCTITRSTNLAIHTEGNFEHPFKLFNETSNQMPLPAVDWRRSMVTYSHN